MASHAWSRVSVLALCAIAGGANQGTAARADDARPTTAPAAPRAVPGFDAARFAAGDWVRLQPDGINRNWRGTQGKWRVNADGSIEGGNDLNAAGQTPANSADRGAKTLLWKGPDLGPAFELSATVEFLPDPLNPLHRGGAFALVYGEGKMRGWAGVDSAEQVAGYAFGSAAGEWTKEPVQLGDKVDLRVRVEGRTAWLWVNGAEVGDAFTLPERVQVAGFGIGGYEGSPVRFSDLRARKAPPMPPRAPRPKPVPPSALAEAQGRATEFLATTEGKLAAVGVGAAVVAAVAGVATAVVKRRRRRAGPPTAPPTATR